MLNRRTLILLGGAGLGSLVVAGLLGPGSPNQAEPPGGTAGTLAFPNLAQRLGGVQRLELRKHDATLLVQRDGDRWLLPEKGNYPVRAERVRETLVGLTELRLLEARTTDPTQFAQLGLDDPTNAGSTAVLLRALEANGSVVAELVVGRRRVRTQGNLPESVYVRRPAESQTWLAEGRLGMDTDPQLWLDRDISNLSAERLRRVTVRRAEQAALVMTRGGEADAKLRLIDPPNPPAQDDATLDEIARAFEFLTFLDVKAAADIPGDALGESRFEYSEGLVVVAWPSRAGDTIWVRLKAEGPGEESTRLNARWNGWAYQLGVWKEKALVPVLADLIGAEAAAPEAPAPAPAPAPAATPAPAAPAQRPANQRRR